MEELTGILKEYALALPVGAIAAIVLIVGLWLGKKVIKLIGLALIVAAILFFVLHM